jgi:sugar phosphate isomerase/epimerase
VISSSLVDQFEEIDPKDIKKADELNQQMAELAGKLGSEYIALVGGLQAMDPDSKGSKEINSTLDALVRSRNRLRRPHARLFSCA